jgi:tetratricopeptide (TPR) repeat protein
VADSPRIEELKRRVHSDPASIAFAALAEEYRRAGRFEDAIETCTAGLIRHPSYLSAHVTLGRALIEVGRLEDARNELEYVLRLAPENLAAIRGLAEIYDRLGEGSHEPPAKGQPHEPAAPAMTVAEIHAASGFIRPVEKTDPAPSFAPAPEPEPVNPQPPFDSGGTTAGSGLAPRETEAVTPPVSFPWEAQPATPPASASFDSRETTGRSGLAPWEAELAASPVPPASEADPAATPVEPFAPSTPAALEPEPDSSYFVISMEEAAAPEAPPALASLSQVEPTLDEPAPRSFDSAPDMPSSSAQGRPDRSRATGLEDFLKAILRARVQRDAFR